MSTEAPVDPRQVSADNALVEIVAARQPLTTDKLGRALAALCAEVDAVPLRPIVVPS